MLGRAFCSNARRRVSATIHTSGGAMVWDTRINPVVDALSSAINDRDIIRDIAMKSGLTMRYVRIAPDAESYWTAILERAQDEGNRRVDAVFEEALTRTQDAFVRDSIDAYRKARDK
jgi:hypothetical protein